MRNALEKELAAVRAVAQALGLGPIEPKVLKLAHHTTVHLLPAPIVARVRACERASASDAELTRELAIASHLASQDAPTARPASTVSPGPYFENGCAISLWEFIEGRLATTPEDALQATQALQRVHHALEKIDIPVPPFSVAFDSCEQILFGPAGCDAMDARDRVFLQELYAELRDQLDRYELKSRPLHGDAHLGNVLITMRGAMWMDLDDVCSGPIEWDVASLPRQVWPAFGDIDLELAKHLAALRSLCVSVWCWADADRSAETRQAAVDHLDELKSRFGKTPTMRG